MVFGVCRRILGNEPDAEDAFQATFIVLLRRAGSIRRHQSLASWLHGVALRLAQRARCDAARRRGHEAQAALTARTICDQLRPRCNAELLTVLDEEIDRLHTRYRAPLLLCYVEGRTHDEAARQLGLPLGTVCSRLARARNLLRARLANSALAPSVGAGVMILNPQELLANVPNALVGATVRLATLLVTVDFSTIAGMSATVAALADGMMKTILISKVKAVAVVVFVAATLTAGIGVWAGQIFVDNSTQANPALLSPVVSQERRPENNRLDADGDPLPTDAVARLGTLRFRHGHFIRFVRFTPDGKKVISHGVDGVRIWEAASGKQLHALPGDTAEYGVSLSTDGKLLATASEAGLFIWDLATATAVRSQTDGRYTSVGFSPDDKKLVVSRSDAKETRIEMLDAKTFHRLWSVSGEQLAYSAVSGIGYSADGKYVIVSNDTSREDRERTLLVLEAQTGREVRRTKLGESVPHKMAVSPDGKLLALLCRKTGSDDFDDHIRLVELADGKERFTLQSPAEEDSTRQKVYSAAIFTPDSKSLITSGGSDGLIVWDAATGNEQRRLGRSLTNSADLALSPGGKQLAVAGANDIRFIRVADGADVMPPAVSRGGWQQAMITRDGKTAITGHGQMIAFWDAVTGRELRRHVFEQRSSVDYLSAISNDGAFAYRTNHADKTLSIRNLATGHDSETIKLEAEGRWAEWVAGVSPDNKLLALVSHSQNRIQLRDGTTGELLKELADPGMKVRRLHFTADGKTLFACCADHTVRVWDVAKGTKLSQIGPIGRLRSQQNIVFRGGGGIDYHSSLSPDGKILATGSNERCLVFYDATTGNELRRSEPLPNGVYELAFSPNGRMVACNEWSDPVIHLFEVETAKLRHSLTGHRGSCSVLNFSPDGKRLISGSNDTTAIIWDLTGRLGAHANLGEPISSADLEACWSDLAGEDAAKAYSAIRKMALSPVQSVPFLAERLTPLAAPTRETVDRLIADLDSDNFETRKNAVKELQALADVARDQYEKALVSRSAEARRQLEALITEHKNQLPTPELLRGLRGIEALEMMGTVEARKVLEALSRGAPAARLTQEAAASLARLSNRP
jgi:RNA polymerase sigma factor (sigma-70 family)